MEGKIKVIDKKEFPRKKFLLFMTITVLAFSLGYIHYKYVSHLFENDRNFSYLSELEREMSFRTEMGFYYSYFKTVVEEKQFLASITKIMYDGLVEFPKDVNAFNRFNIHPEVMIGAMYRYLEPWLNTSAYRECHMVSRGEGLAPVESCVGIGQPVFFYLETIWWLAGLTVAALFLHATALSDSILGGLLAVAQYFANHGECTRVMWAPNERENLAGPLLLLQAWLVSAQLRDTRRGTTFQLQAAISFVNCLCLLFWQFTQFIFFTQTAIFLVMEQLRIIDLKSLCIFLHSHFGGLHMAILLLQGNDMLKSSLYSSLFLVVSAYCLFFSSLRIKVKTNWDLVVEAWLILLRLSIILLASVYLKQLICDFLELKEDAHVWEILYSKFTNFKNFHTMLYTCSAVFDFMPLKTVFKLCKSLLIPTTVFAIANVCNYVLRNAYNDWTKEMNKPEKDSNIEDSDSGIENSDRKDEKCNSEELGSVVVLARCVKVDPAVVFNVAQLVAYALLAALVMRLKLLLVPQMCIVSSLLMNHNYYLLPKNYMKYLPLFWVLCFIPLAFTLVNNVSEELAHIGEFSDLPQEELMQWISRETTMTGAFAGSMPILAAVMLSTRRPVVAHPHYEHYEARQRAYSVYKVYGKFTPFELYQELNKMRVTYLIIENKYCYGKST
ncbi:hypothetical protein O3G_MSEX013716 [Manduca sexta]|uniref:C-mannosyltransferase DPY19L1 n=1 Tax=Manduca sexta TaxID=7130 RepID=A0A922CXF3_MANSE|nr:hypothetical protein O3G_MSEX013716 [Manduca sexta]